MLHGAGMVTYIWMIFELHVDEYYMEHMGIEIPSVVYI